MQPLGQTLDPIAIHLAIPPPLQYIPQTINNDFGGEGEFHVTVEDVVFEDEFLAVGEDVEDFVVVFDTGVLLHGEGELLPE